ncbi:hypothetical protein DLM85_08565 [Hymenobacter edaphi]|uniref:Uncharacterized protein n=2 Tax=Hymenobacter edaphi TaxID=2211146 RepID=A0A328BKU0_9BACT|nr:hypothetical protein DLM85_08565 [Hymenobacter edaphi]
MQEKLPSTAAPDAPQPLPVEEDPYISFTIQVRRSTYVQLKQAEYWTPGFGLMREHVDEAIKAHLAALPGSTQPLPPKELTKFMNSKKMKVVSS